VHFTNNTGFCGTQIPHQVLQSMVVKSHPAGKTKGRNQQAGMDCNKFRQVMRSNLAGNDALQVGRNSESNAAVEAKQALSDSFSGL
jgi:hypothetical protein